MGRSISNPTTGVIVNINIPIAKGGTGATTAAGALTNLGLVANSDSSIVRLGADLKVAATDVPAMPVKALVSGPSSVVGGNTTGYTYTITNLDSATTYTIGAFGGGTVKWTGGTLSANNGTVSGNAATFVYYPNPSTDASAGLWVDGRQIAMASVTQSTIGKPIINSGVNLTGQVEKPTLAGSAYSAVQSLSGTTLLRSEWEFYTASNYTGTPITQSSNATSMTLTTALAHGTSYYVRVRYVCSYTLGGAASATEQYSAWSNDAASPFTLATMAEFTMGSPAGTVYGGVASSITINSYDATATYTVSGTNMTATPTRTGSTISFTPTVSATTASITLNDGHGAVTQNITVTPSVVNGPASWTAPATDGITGQGSSVTLTFTDPSPLGIGLYASDTHTSTDWQITSSDPATDNWTTFTAADGAVNLVASTTNKNSYTVTGLVVSKTYWYRARIKSSSGAVGAWSVGRSFTTKSSFVPSAQQAQLLVSTGSGLSAAASDVFGWSVALSSDGNTALIGCINRDTGATNAGAAYVFTRSGTTWSYQTELLISTGGGPTAAMNDCFGYSVALSSDGNTALIGCCNRDTGATNAGAAYVFTRNGAAWSFQKELLISTGSSLVAGMYDAFGVSVALSADGNTALIGAHSRNNNAGAAYVFTRSGTTWGYQKELLISTGSGLSPAASDYFGCPVALSSDGNTALIGAYGRNNKAGAAYVFTRSGTTWGYQTQLLISTGSGLSAAVDDYFGISVALSSDGNTALIGAYGRDTGATDAGAAYVFTRSGTTWGYQKELLISTGSGLSAATTDYFGISVALSSDGNTALIGCCNRDTGATDAGAAYVFTRSGTTWGYQKELLISTGSGLSAAVGDYFGWSVALSSDGHTALIKCPYRDTDATDAGALYVYV